jgi:hypothetical protein
MRFILFTDDIHAELDALVADENGGAGDEFPNLVLALTAERAIQSVLGIAAAGLIHWPSSTPIRPSNCNVNNSMHRPGNSTIVKRPDTSQ